MVKVKIKNGDITKFLHAWDKKAYDLNIELKKMLLKQKRGRLSHARKKDILLERISNWRINFFLWIMKRIVKKLWEA